MLEKPSDSIGLQLLFENDRVRVWDTVLKSGEELPLHRHSSDYLFIYTTPGRITVYPAGQPQTTEDYDDGYVQYVAVGTGVVHKIRNVGETVHRHVIVEIKGPSVVPTPQEPQHNGRRRPTPV